jgi:hypothetical protein
LIYSRYQNPHVEHARYLFLAKDAAGKADLDTFRRLMGLVKQAYPAVVGKIEVKELKNKESSSGAETYLGVRFGQPTGVIEHHVRFMPLILLRRTKRRRAQPRRAVVDTVRPAQS